MQHCSTHMSKGTPNLLDPDVNPSGLKPPWITSKPNGLSTTVTPLSGSLGSPKSEMIITSSPTAATALSAPLSLPTREILISSSFTVTPLSASLSVPESCDVRDVRRFGLTKPASSTQLNHINASTRALIWSTAGDGRKRVNNLAREGRNTILRVGPQPRARAGARGRPNWAGGYSQERQFKNKLLCSTRLRIHVLKLPVHHPKRKNAHT